MSLSIDITTQLTSASRVLEAMKGRIRTWHKKASGADKQKVQERANEIMTLETALMSAQRNLTPIIISESNDDTYRRGFDAAERKCSHDDLHDLRRLRPSNNEAYRRAHNAAQREKWADHY